VWKYILLNSLWFSILFLVHFFGSKRDQRMVLVLMFVTIFYLAFYTTMDPFVWFYYLIFSVLVFYGAGAFKSWAFARLVTMDDLLKDLSGTLEARRTVLEQKNADAELSGTKANEIIRLYDETKEMSKSLGFFENFLVFGEALASNFQFQTVKLALFGDEMRYTQAPVETYELHYSHFKGLFDRGEYLKDAKKAKGKIFPFDQKVYKRIFRERRPLEVMDAGHDFYESGGFAKVLFAAYPVFIHERIFAVVAVIGVRPEDQALLNILVGRFVWEMQRIKLYQQIETLAITDGLTGVFVRRHLLERLQGELDRSRRFGLKLSFLMIDVDHFKRFNDEYGHLVGDVVLREVARTIRKNIREVDLLGRYGGEEFGVLLVETDEPGALLVAERIRRSVQSREFEAYDERLKVTVSIGCCSYSQNLDDVNLLVESADSALYQSKRQGRNRVSFFTFGPASAPEPRTPSDI
jgi:diguanylate cyclase (GGDEF)-like protein